MRYPNVDDMVRRLSTFKKTKATKKLVEFYSKARFMLDDNDFSRQYTDGENDGGIDFYHIEGNSFYIFQSKFSGDPRKTSDTEISHEISKIGKTLMMENPNRRAEGFVNHLRRSLSEDSASLEIVWLTTNIVLNSVRDAAQQLLKEIRNENGWEIRTEFIAIDKNDLESVIFDFSHGYIPQTGKKSVKLEYGTWIENAGEETDVYSVVCTVKANDILRWFNNLQEIDNFLQKNVRGFLGDKGINRGIEKSYLNAPNWFWYKHNGIIVFADSIEIDKTNEELVFRNPQIVNGGQTLKVLYAAYDRCGKRENSAEVLLRAYRLPYDRTETYRTSIDIIEALNSQNKILPSDLRSNDPRQVRLERLFADMGYKYYRKRAKGIKSGKSSIPMWKLASLYYCCKKHAPHSAVAMYVQELFREASRYNHIFNQAEIGRKLRGNHVILKYITVWNLAQILRSRRRDLPDKDYEYFTYSQYFVLADIYDKLMDWKSKKFRLTWKSWREFVESEELAREIWPYAKFAFRVATSIIPVDQEPRSFFRSKASTKKFDARTSKRKFQICLTRAFNKFYDRTV